MKRLCKAGFGAFLAWGMLTAYAAAQGLLVGGNAGERLRLPRPVVGPRPTPPMAYKIKELAVNARILDQVARVQVGQSFVNTGSQQMEVSFIFPLPYDGAVDRLTFLVDGKEIPAKLLSADEARKIYEDHVRRSRDPALLEWMGTGMFQTSIFPIPAGAERKVTLRYSQLLRKDHNLTDFLFPLATAKYTSAPVDKVEIKASIESSIEIKSVYSPTHAIDVKRPGSTSAAVSYVVENQVPTGDFRLFFSVAKGKLGASVIGYRPHEDEAGYFLLLASPQIKPPDAERPKKTVLCVFDRSGSMSGEKIEQAKKALKFVLDNLRDGDLFNIVAYDSEVEAFRPELERYSNKTRKQALGFVEGLYAGGATNIHGALTTAMGMLKDSSRPNFIIFLTDGQPTVGEVNESKIVEATEGANRVRARLVGFGVGYDVNSRLLERLCRANYGRSEYVRPNEDIEVQVSRLYNKISSPVMTDVAVKFEFDQLKVEEGEPVGRMYPSQLTDLFEGEQLAIVGRYKKTGVAKVKITGRVSGADQKFDFPIELVKKSKDQSYSFVEKLWAMRRIGEIIDELDLKGRNDELIKELVALSTKHGVLTPYTSFLADENAAVGDLAADDAGARGLQFRRAENLLGRLGEVDGIAAFAQRDAGREFREAQLALPAMQHGANGRLGTKLRDIDRDAEILVEAVQVIDNQVLYKRGGDWYSFDVAKKDADKLAGKAKVVKRFSEEYFDLIRKSPPAAAKALARQKEGEAMTLEAAGEVYRVE